ncbi:MAG: enoyl-CoA hydratase/isomerase family protein [Halobacteriales archaeon]
MVTPDHDFETVAVEIEDSTGLASVQLNRPDKLNAINAKTREEIAEAFDWLRAQDDAADGFAVSVVILSGAGDRAFSAGADLDEFTMAEGDDFNDADLTRFDLPRMYDSILDYGAPVIAKIGGYCLGGAMELALCCDFLIASEGSELGNPEIDTALPPGGGGTQRLPDRVGASMAKELCMTGRYVSGTEAEEIGLVDHVYPDDELDAEVREFAESIAERADPAVRSIKHLVNMADSVPTREGHKKELHTFFALQRSDAYRETLGEARDS